MTLANDVAAEVNREEARLRERGHNRRGRLGIIRRPLRPRPRVDVRRERVTVADRRGGLRRLEGMVISRGSRRA